MQVQKEYIASYDFRSNTHRGAEAMPYILSDEEHELVLKASRASKAYMVGVDHIVNNKKPYILEINGSPGSGADYQGYQYKDYYSDPEPSGRIDGEKMMEYLVDYISDRTNWDRQSFNREWLVRNGRTRRWFKSQSKI